VGRSVNPFAVDRECEQRLLIRHFEDERVVGSGNSRKTRGHHSGDCGCWGRGTPGKATEDRKTRVSLMRYPLGVKCSPLGSYGIRINQFLLNFGDIASFVQIGADRGLGFGR